MPGRNYAASRLYKYGFNGKENDNEVIGEGNQQDYGMRVYDPRLGKFLSVDPIAINYPELTPYQFSSNSPITFIDLDGLEMAWKNPSTGQTIPAGPITSPVGTINSNGWVLFASPQTKKSITSSINNDSKPPIQSTTLEGGSDYFTSVNSSLAKERALSKGKPPAKTARSNPTMKIDTRTNAERAQASKQRQDFEASKRATSADPFAAALARSSIQTASLYVNGVIEHGKGVYNEVINQNYWGAAKNVALLAMDASPFLLKGSTTITSNIPKRLARIIPEQVAGSPTLGAPGATDVFVVDAAYIQGINNSTDLAKRLTLLDESNNFIKGPFRVIEFDTPASGLASPLNRTNPGFVNGGRTAGGAQEYVLPNLQVSSLNNVIQKTIQ